MLYRVRQAGLDPPSSILFSVPDLDSPSLSHSPSNSAYSKDKLLALLSSLRGLLLPSPQQYEPSELARALVSLHGRQCRYAGGYA